MRTHSPENERIKRAYFTYLKEARRLSEHSIDAAAAALSRFEEYTRYRDFKSFHVQQAIAFKRKFAEQVSARTGEPLSKRTLFGTLNSAARLFPMAGGPTRLSLAPHLCRCRFLLIVGKGNADRQGESERPVPTLEQIHHVLQSMPADTDVELRNRALVAFTILTGARDGAVASMKLKHVDTAEGKVVQDAREVNTKFSKSFITTFFPVGQEVRQIVVEWVTFLTNEKLFGPTDPLFPATQVVLGAGHCFQAGGLSRSHWSNATPIRAIFKEAFEHAGLPYANPHSFRKTLAQLGERLCRTPEEFKAWSQNLGHEQVLTTFSSYGNLTGRRQAELIRNLGRRSETPSNVDPIDQAMRLLEQARHRSL